MGAGSWRKLQVSRSHKGSEAAGRRFTYGYPELHRDAQPTGGYQARSGSGVIVTSVTGLVDAFYADVVQNLKAWAALAPKVQSGPPDSTLTIDGPHAKSADSLAGGETESTVAEIVTEAPE